MSKLHEQRDLIAEAMVILGRSRSRRTAREHEQRIAALEEANALLQECTELDPGSRWGVEALAATASLDAALPQARTALHVVRARERRRAERAAVEDLLATWLVRAR